MWSCWLCWICWICSTCPLGLVRAEIGTLLSTNMLTWQLSQLSISISIAYLFAGVQISSLTVARHRGQLRPGASSRDFPHPPSTLPLFLPLCLSLSVSLGYFTSEKKEEEEEIKRGWTSKCIDPGGVKFVARCGFLGWWRTGNGLWLISFAEINPEHSLLALFTLCQPTLPHSTGWLLSVQSGLLSESEIPF